MMTIPKRILASSLALALMSAILILAACGEDNSPGIADPDPDPDPIPSTALETDLSSLFFDFAADSTTLTLLNAGEDTLRWSASTETPWCRPAEDEGILESGESHVLAVRVARESLGTGLFVGSLTLQTQFGQSLEVALSLRNYRENLFPLEMTPRNVEYDSVLDRVVLVAGDPSPSRLSFYLHVIDPRGHTAERVAVGSSANCLAVDPAGGLVAVGHNRKISYVDIRTMEVVEEYRVDFNVGIILLPGNGWIYAITSNSGWAEVHCLEIATGLVHAPVGHGSVSSYAGARLHPSGLKFHFPAYSGLYELDLRGGIAEFEFLEVAGEYNEGNSVYWYIEGGNKILFRRGRLYSLAESDADTTRHLDTLDLGPHVIDDLSWAEDVPNSNMFMALTQTALRIYDVETLQLRSMNNLPGFFSGGEIRPSQTRWGFCSLTFNDLVLLIEDHTGDGGWATAVLPLEGL